MGGELFGTTGTANVASDNPMPPPRGQLSWGTSSEIAPTLVLPEQTPSAVTVQIPGSPTTCPAWLKTPIAFEGDWKRCCEPEGPIILPST